jgi:2'-5' RNA ligase
MKTPPANSTLINVCILPPEPVSQQCEAISQSLESDATMFVLGRGKFAHMTAFMARFPDATLTKVVEKMEELVRTTQSFRCEHTGYFMTAGRYLEVSYRKSDDFMELHESLIHALSGLRINPGHPHEEDYFAPYTPGQQRNARDTGYDLARELYRPHITLTRYHDRAVPETFPAFPESNLLFELSRVGVYKADANGAVYEELAAFTL